MIRMILDAGAFVAYEKADARMRARLIAAHEAGVALVTSSTVVAQVWRGKRQARLARLLASTFVDAPEEHMARRAGELLAATKTTDVVDALLVLLARAGDAIVTSDAADLRRLVAAARLEVRILET